MSENPKAMSMVDSGQFEDGAIIRDDDQYFIVKSVLASEIVQPYRTADGKTFMAYKPADELEKATLTFRGVPIKALSHPKGSHIEEAEDDNGRVENPVFRKDLMDPKTKRPCRRGIVGDLCFYRPNSLEVKTGNYTAVTDEIVQKMREGALRDNSIGFNCYTYPTPGEWQGQHYDVVQRRIRGNHLAAPIEKGRCPSPYCGINMDSAEPLEKQVIEVKDADLGISYHFDKAKFTDEQAKLWVEKRTAKDCPVCTRILDAGLLVAGQRLFKQYGADVLEVVEGHPLPTSFSDAMSLMEIEGKLKEMMMQKEKMAADDPMMKQLDLDIATLKQMQAKMAGKDVKLETSEQLISRVGSLVKNLSPFF